MATEKVLIIEEELDDLVHRLDLAESSCRVLCTQVEDKRRELEDAQAEDDG